MAKCAIPECDGETRPKSKLTMCSLCQGNLNRWLKRSVVEVLERRRKLHMYDHRMGKVENIMRPTKVKYRERRIKRTIEHRV
jgi:hypothetical protein